MTLRRSILLAMGLISLASSSALIAQTQATALIEGTVSADQTDDRLAGATIRVQETGQTFSSSADGRFILRGLAPGSYTLIFSYLGLDSVTQTVQVAATQSQTLNVILGNPTQLEEVLVIGSRGAQASSLNQQRASISIANFISADDAGRFPDTNAAEALQRISGVSINREEKGGEGRYVSIRGLDSSLNNFKLNGINVAQTDSDSRRVAMDVFQVNALSKIVVHKTLLPNMDGDGIGGSVELETSSAFDLGEQQWTFTAEGNYNNFAEDLGQKISTTYSTLFGDEQQFGFLISGTYDQRDTLGYNNLQDEEYIPLMESDEGEPIDFSNGNDLVPWWFGLGDFDNERENVGVSVAFDWRVSDFTTLKFKGSHNKLDDFELSNGFFIIADDDELYQDGIYNPEGGTVYRVRSEYEESVFTNNALSFSGETVGDSLTFAYGLGYAQGLFDEPNDYEVGFEYELSGPVLYDYSDAYFPQPILSAADQQAIRDPANFTLGGNDIDADESEDEKITAHFDVTFAPTRGVITAWQGGVKLLQSTRSLFEANVLDAQGDLTLAGSVFEGGFMDTSKIGSPYGDILRLNGDAVKNWRQIGADLVNSGVLENDYAGEIDDEDSYEADENIFAAYLMATAEQGPWEIVGGARVEHTRFESRGYTLVEDDNGESLSNRVSKSDNTQVLPRLQVNYRSTDQLVFRGAAFTSVARPEFQFLNAATEIEIEDGDSIEAFVGNPDLDPAYAWNFDLGAEYYLSSIGLISANVFYKRISDFIFADAAPEGSTISTDLEAQYPGFNLDVETVFNGEDATVYGAEFTYTDQFTALPGIWGGFGVSANITLQRSEADTGLEGRGKVDFFNAPERVGTLALTYQKYGLQGNLAYTFRDDSLEELGPYLIDKYQQAYNTLDLQLRYAITPQWEAHFSVIDLLDDDLDPVVHKTLGRQNRYPEDLTFNGTTFKFGITGRF